jgi:EAL domain-containing protein (putative c-di-GMP-specific phosphodiesterase class I)
LEITESVIMENSTQAASLLRQLEAMEVHVHLDDFGTGYSSLAYLHNFRMDALKIDGSFVRRVGPRGENGEIIRTIVHLARDLGMQVIAEGVETADQMALLRELRCDCGQGFLFSPALDASRVEELMGSKRPWPWSGSQSFPPQARASQ